MDGRACACYLPRVDDLEGFRQLLRARLQERGALSRLSEQSGLSTAVLSRWRDGIGRPSDTNLKRLAPALGVPYEDLAKMCGYMPGEPSSSAVESELDSRLAKLGATLSKYPRAVWLAVLEANERMADALAHNAEPPVSASEKGRVSASDAGQNGDTSNDRGPFTLRKRLPEPSLA